MTQDSMQMISKRFCFVVETQPKPKERPRTVMVKRGNKKVPVTFTPKSTRIYEKQIREAAEAAIHELWAVFDEEWTLEAVDHELVVRVYRAAMRGDLDNFVKCVSDALNGVAYPDDRHVTSMQAWMGLDRKRPRVEVEVRKLVFR